jgi:hypothetical protein
MTWTLKAIPPYLRFLFALFACRPGLATAEATAASNQHKKAPSHGMHAP